MQDNESNAKPSVETLPATIRCLKCRLHFNSEHRIKERVCKECKSSTLWRDDSPMSPDGYGDAFDIAEQAEAY